MSEHYTRSTVSVQAFCTKCRKFTMHRVDHVGLNAGGRKGPCLECILRLELAKASKQLSEPEKQEQRVLDPCCGGRMFWFDKNNADCVFGDIRRQTGIIYDRRDGRGALKVEPDQIMDVTDLPFPSGRFSVVVFDPPHLTSVGPKSWQGAKYGCLPKDWEPFIRKGFEESFRVLAENGTLIFKWSEVHIPLRKVLALAPAPPLFGQTTTVNLRTHWIVFIKPESA